jgi:hypothetical protein
VKKFKFKNGLLASLLLIAAFAVTSCGSDLPRVVAPAVQNYPALTSTQVDNVYSDILDTLKHAEDGGDVELLKPRFAGPALDIRRTQINVQKQTGNEDVNAAIPEVIRQYVVSNSPAWPRDVFAITNPTHDRQTERILVIDQENARSRYKLWAVARLFTGIDLPKFDVPEKGSESLGANDITILAKPVDVLTHYADVLENEDQSKFAKDFANDPLRSEIKSSYQTAGDELSKLEGNQTQTFKVNPDRIRALRTADAGAVAVGEIESEWIRTVGANVSATPASDAEKAVFDGSDYSGSIYLKYISVVAVYIPPKGSYESVKVIGAERYPVYARKN